MIVLPKTQSDLLYKCSCEFDEDFRAEQEMAVYVVEHLLLIIIMESVQRRHERDSDGLE
jgi:hypothetical protein